MTAILLKLRCATSTWYTIISKLHYLWIQKLVNIVLNINKKSLNLSYFPTEINILGFSVNFHQGKEQDRWLTLYKLKIISSVIHFFFLLIYLWLFCELFHLSTFVSPKNTTYFFNTLLSKIYLRSSGAPSSVSFF